MTSLGKRARDFLGNLRSAFLLRPTNMGLTEPALGTCSLQNKLRLKAPTLKQEGNTTVSSIAVYPG